MSHMDSQTQAALSELDSLGWWYQHVKLPNGLWTGDGQRTGVFVGAALEDDRALCAGGSFRKDSAGSRWECRLFSILMKRRGAARCVHVDPHREFLCQADFAARQFRIDLVCADSHTYCLTTDERFDYVLFLGLLYQSEVSRPRAGSRSGNDDGTDLRGDGGHRARG